MHERAALRDREDAAVDLAGVVGVAEHEAAARAAQRLVRRAGDELGVAHGGGVDAGGDEAGDVRHVGHVHCADAVGDLAGALEVDAARVGRRAGHDELRPVLLGKARHLLVVDGLALAVDAVGDELEEAAAEVDVAAMGQVSALVEPHAHDRVAGLEHGEVDGHVRLRAGVGLDVRVVGSEERLRALDGERLDLVDKVAAAVVTAAGESFGVLVGEHAADGFEDGLRGEVLGGDHLERRTLPALLARYRRGYRRVRLRERRAQVRHHAHVRPLNPSTCLSFHPSTHARGIRQRPGVSRSVRRRRAAPPRRRARASPGGGCRRPYTVPCRA